VARRFHSFAEFWPFYLSEHRQPLCRGLHYFGTATSLVLAVIAALTRHFALIAAAPVFGYGCSWIGHFFVEKNRPATFQYPFYSFAGDFVMLGKMLRGKIDADLAALDNA
jgi:hypothetical protein